MTLRPEIPLQLQENIRKLVAQGNPLGINVPGGIVQSTGLTFANPLLALHGFWKSRVYEVHCNWSEVTDSVDVEKLDKKNLSAEKVYEKHEMPPFKLGDRVKIVRKNKRLFKILHKKVGLWREGLTELIGKEAIVMNVLSKFAIGVALTESGEMAQLHGFAIELVKNGIYKGLWQNNTEFKVDDEVVIGVESEVLAHLQRTVRKTPHHIATQFIGCIGRVMCVYRREVVVTFDEMRHEMFNPAALKLYKNKEKGDKKKMAKKTSKTDIEVGSHAFVKSDLRMVMRQQRGHGEWHLEMTKFIGKRGDVVDNLPGGDVNVKFNTFEIYRMNRQNLYFGDKKRNRSGTNPSSDALIPFVVGDIVRLNINPDDLQSHLQLLRIPAQFITIVGDLAEFIGYIDEFRCVVKFGDGIQFESGVQLLAKVTDLVAKIATHLKTEDQAIGVGKDVVLSVGPESFVRACLKEFKPGFEKALSEAAKVVGYDENGNAVIEYSDGKMYKLPDEYLCSPRPQWLKQNEGGVLTFDWNLEAGGLVASCISAIEASILNSVTEVLKANGEKDALNWKSYVVKDATSENTKVIDLTFPTELKDFDKFKERFISKLQHDGIHSQMENEVLVINTNGQLYQLRFKFGFKENDIEDLASMIGGNSGGKSQPKPAVFGRSLSVTDTISESDPASNLATPFGSASTSIQIPAGVTQVVLQLGGIGQLPVAPPAAGPVQEPHQQGNLSISPANSTVINMYGDGENKVNIDKSYVRSVNA
uniref:uncharacterized protein LOC120335007 n=1 Tax=Styela clava TaxID=7725 RepID=UPI00193A7A8F|nr:uncharacterized protein LOC120335007 [Styela clava]